MSCWGSTGPGRKNGKRGGPRSTPVLEGTQVHSPTQAQTPEPPDSERKKRPKSRLLYSWAALDAKHLPGSIASLPLPSPHSHTGTELVAAGDKAEDQAHPWVLLRCLEGGEARHAGGQEEVEAALLRRAGLSDRAVPNPQRVLLLGQPSVHAVQRPLSFVPPLRAGSGRVS